MASQFQCILNAVWLLLRQPTPDYAPIIDHEQRTYAVYHFCEAFEEGDMAIAFVMPFVLLLLTLGYAYMARKIPGRFNETRYVLITTCSTCILWLSFIPIFIATNENQIPTRVFALCAAPAFNATVTLLCMFGPPVYVVLWRPHKNTKETVLGRKADQQANNAVEQQQLQAMASTMSEKRERPRTNSYSFTNSHIPTPLSFCSRKAVDASVANYPS